MSLALTTKFPVATIFMAQVAALNVNVMYLKKYIYSIVVLLCLISVFHKLFFFFFGFPVVE